MSKLLITLLGSFQAKFEGGQNIEFEADKSRALLAYLAVEGNRPHRREYLADLLWPSRPETLARNNLRQSIYRIRLALGDHDNYPPFLLANPQTIQINPDSKYWVDVAEFLQLIDSAHKHHPQGISLCETCSTNLSTAVDLYQGDFLSGFSSIDSPSFEWWLLSQQEALHVQALETLSSLSNYFERRLDFNTACLYLRRSLELEPFSETAHKQLIRLLALSGQRSAALRQFDECKNIFANELGISPSPQITLLYERIRDGDFEALEDDLKFWAISDQPVPSLDTTKPIFVSRERELSQIEYHLKMALNGNGRVTVITGDAGSGKTMLLQESARQAIKKYGDLIVVSGVCNAHNGMGEPYYPFIEILRSLAGDQNRTALDPKISEELGQRLWVAFPIFLRAMITYCPDLIGKLTLEEPFLVRAKAHGWVSEDELMQLEDLNTHNVRKLFLNSDALYTMLEQSSGDIFELGRSKVNQSALFTQVAEVLKSIAYRFPLLILIDDMQWLDRASAELLLHLGQNLQGSKILVLGAYRSEEITSKTEQDHHPLLRVIHELKIRTGDIEIDLAKAEGRKFLDAIIDSEPNDLDEAFRQSLFSLTNGHALFTVELLRGMQKRGDLLKNNENKWIIGPNLCWDQIPTRVEATIAEHLRRVSGNDHKLLSFASVQGESFTAEVIARFLGLEPNKICDQLRGALSKKHKLITALGVEFVGNQTLSHFRFRHQLHQKYLYQSLDAIEKAHLHEATGRALESLVAELPGETRLRIAGASLMAWHFEKAGLPLEAASYLLQAGINAYQISANLEAVDYFNRGLNLLTTPKETSNEVLYNSAGTPEHAQLELILLIALCAPLRALYGHASSVVGHICEQASFLALKNGDEPRHFFAQWLHLTHFFSRADYMSALKIGENLKQLTRASGLAHQQAQADFALGMVELHIGKFKSAREHFRRTLNTPSICEGDLTIMPMIQNIRSCCLIFDAWALWFLGFPNQALECSQEAVALAKSASHFNSLAFALALGDGVVRLLRREYALMEEKAENLRKLSTEYNFDIFSLWGKILHGRGQVEHGDLDEGFKNLNEGIAAYRNGSQKVETTLFLITAAEASTDPEYGLNALHDAHTFMQSTGETYLEAEISRLRGEHLLAMGKKHGALAKTYYFKAEACFREAIHIAQQQGAKSLELRAAISLSKLLHQRHRSSEAVPILKEIYSSFSEGFETRDLIEACTLLEDLSSAK